MAMQWVKKINQAGELSYHLDPSLKGSWPVAVKDAVKEFNGLSRQHKLGVLFAPTDEAPSERGGAAINIATGNGKVEFSYGGKHSTSINGTGLQGLTQLVSVNDSIEKAFMFLPAMPMVNTPKGRRPIGVGVMKAIAVHELIHACGLHNSDHTEDDIFNGYPSVDYGHTPAQDRLQIRSKGRYRFMPPLLFSAATAAKIRRLWR